MKLVILDRDGVINHDSDSYIKTPDEWRPLPRSLEAISLLNYFGFTVVVFTNQSGIGRGYFSKQALFEIHEKMNHAVGVKGGKIEKIFVCPHKPSDGCFCRKPNPGMLLQIAEEFQTSLYNVPIVGDRETDMQAAESVHGRPLLISSDDHPKYETFSSLWEAAHYIIEESL